MNLIRLGDRLDETSLEVRKPYFRAADNLAKRIFNPVLTQDVLEQYYLQSTKRSSTEDDSADDEDAPLFADLGEYERTLVGKLLSPVRKVLCIVGPLGSGKTTTIRYVVRRLEKRPHSNCDAAGCCQEKRMISVIDFNERPFKFAKTEERAASLLFEELCNQLRAKLKAHGMPEHKEELTEFWGEEIERLRNGDPLSAAFVRIVNQLPQDSLFASPPLSARELQTREQVLALLEQDKEAYLDYLVRLWGYVIRVCYAGNHGCAFLVFDNIDKASAIVQSALLSIVQSCARDPGPTFVLLVRPETFDRLGMGTDIIDIERHRGPVPSQVILDRLQRFSGNADAYFLPREGLKREDFALIKDFLLKVQRIIETDAPRPSPYLTFLDKACGRSLRLALLTAQNLLRVSEYDMSRDTDLSAYSLIRLSVNQGEAQFKARRSSPVVNLFHVGMGGKGRLLVKSRALKYLLSCPEKQRTLNEIKQILKAFGYQESTLIREAVNEMMNIYCQLVRSDGFDSYTEREFLNAGTQRITLTEIGDGYVTYLLRSIDYIQEVMLDSYVSPDRFGLRISYSYLPDKFLLLNKFLNELRLADVEETSHFIQNRGKSEYFDTFGNYLISLEIIWEVHQAVSRIVQSLRQQVTPSERRRSDRWLSYDRIAGQFKSLLYQVANDNHESLGLWPEYVRDGDSERSEMANGAMADLA